jgi:outer membrane murein-binding lipoprotein Lpp
MASHLRLRPRVGPQGVGRMLNLSSSASREGADFGGSYESWRKQWLQPAILLSLGTAAVVAGAWYVEILGLPAQVKQVERNIERLEKHIDIKIDALSTSTNAKIDATNAKIDALSASTNAKIDALSSKFDSLNDFKIQLLIRMDKSETRSEKRWFG